MLQLTSQAVACLPPPTTGVCSDSLVAFSPLDMVTGTRADHAVDSPILETCLRLIGLTHGESVPPTAIRLLRACCDKRMCSLVPPWAIREVEAFVAHMYPCGTMVYFSPLQPALDGFANRMVEDNACVDWRSALSVASLASRSCLTWPDCCFSYVHQHGWIVQFALFLAESWYDSLVAFSPLGTVMRTRADHAVCIFLLGASGCAKPSTYRCIHATMGGQEADRSSCEVYLQYLAFAAGATTCGGKSSTFTHRLTAPCQPWVTVNLPERIP
jgi:hypothetical protein